MRVFVEGIVLVRGFSNNRIRDWNIVQIYNHLVRKRTLHFNEVKRSSVQKPDAVVT